MLLSDFQLCGTQCENDWGTEAAAPSPDTHRCVLCLVSSEQPVLQANSLQERGDGAGSDI